MIMPCDDPGTMVSGGGTMITGEDATLIQHGTNSEPSWYHIIYNASLL